MTYERRRDAERCIARSGAGLTPQWPTTHQPGSNGSGITNNDANIK